MEPTPIAMLTISEGILNYGVWLLEPSLRLRYNIFSRDHGIEYPTEVKSRLRWMMGDCSRLDILLQGRETFTLSNDWTVEILHVPGHTPGHIAFWDPKEREHVAWKVSERPREKKTTLL